MTTPLKPHSVQQYQIMLYDRALHPAVFPLKQRKLVHGPAYHFEMWAMPGAHLFRFEKGPLCVCELVADGDTKIPQNGIVTVFPCLGEREFEHHFDKAKVTYMSSVQTETLTENPYLATLEEMLRYAAESDAVMHRWQDEAGECLTMLDVQRYSREIHAQAHHMLASTGLVLRTQTIFEHA